MAVPFFKSTPGGGDQTDGFANKQGLWIDFYHVPTGNNVYFKAFVENIQETTQAIGTRPMCMVGWTLFKLSNLPQGISLLIL